MASDYRMKRGSSTRVATVPCCLAPPLKQAWQIDGSGLFWEMPLTNGILAYVPSPTARGFLALDEASWEERWRFSQTGRPAVIHEGQLIGWTDDHVAWRLGGTTGSELSAIAAPAATEVVVVGQILVARRFDERSFLYGRDLMRPDRAWTFRPTAPPGRDEIQGTFCADDRAAYTGLWDGSVTAVSLETGEQLWLQKAAGLEPGRFPGTPPPTQGVAIVMENVVIFRFPTNIAGVSATDGRVLWKAPIQLSSDGYLYDGRYYVTTQRGEYFILDPGTGRVLLDVDLKGEIADSRIPLASAYFSPILVSETHTFVGLESGWLLAFERDTGRLAWKHRPKGAGRIQPASYFASANGRLYYADMSFALYCLEEENATDPVLKAWREQGRDGGEPRVRGRGRARVPGAAPKVGLDARKATGASGESKKDIGKRRGRSPQGRRKRSRGTTGEH